MRVERRSVWAVALVVALAVAGCGRGSVRYVKNQKAGVFVAVPRSWGVFTLRDGHPMELGAKQVTNGASAIAENETPWLVGFDGAPEPTRADFESKDLPVSPIGSVQVLPIAADAKLPRTLAGLRSLFTDDGTDPVTDPQAGFTVKDYAQLEFPSGHWGVRLTFERTSGSDVHRTEAIAAFDRTVSRVYIVEVECSAACFDANAQQIDAVLGSLTLEKR